MAIDDEVVENPRYCTKCSKRIFPFMTDYTLYMDSKFAPRNSDFQRDGNVYLCKKCFQCTQIHWMQRPPISRPNGWWKRNVDPRLKGWTRVKEKLFTPIMDEGPCDNCEKEKSLYKVEFPTGRKGAFGIDKKEKRYFCEECIRKLSKFLSSRSSS